MPGKRVLELGAGASPLVALAALRAGAARVVATDGSPDALRLLETNLAANAGRAAHSDAGSDCRCFPLLELTENAVSQGRGLCSARRMHTSICPGLPGSSHTSTILRGSGAVWY